MQAVFQTHSAGDTAAEIVESVVFVVLRSSANPTPEDLGRLPDNWFATGEARRSGNVDFGKCLFDHFQILRPPEAADAGSPRWAALRDGGPRATVFAPASREGGHAMASKVSAVAAHWVSAMRSSLRPASPISIALAAVLAFSASAAQASAQESSAAKNHQREPSRATEANRAAVQVLPMVAAEPQVIVEVHPTVAAAIRQIAAEQVTHDLGEVRAAAAGAYEAAQASQASASSDMALIVGLMECFLAFIALLFVVAAFAGWDRWKRIAALGAEAQAKLDLAKSTLAEASTASSEIGKMRSALAESGVEVEMAFGKLPPVEFNQIMRLSPPAAIDPEVRCVFEDCDTLLIVSDRLGIISDKTKCAELFRKLGVFWRVADGYATSYARLERACELDPTNARLANEVGKTLSFWAAEQPPGSESRGERLQLALLAHERALELSKAEDAYILHDLGWTYDEIGDLEHAVEFYRRAAEIPHDRRWKTCYDLACSLSRLKRFEEALSALKECAEIPTLPIEADPDFAEMREDPKFGPQFSAIVAKIKKAT